MEMELHEGKRRSNDYLQHEVCDIPYVKEIFDNNYNSIKVRAGLLFGLRFIRLERQELTAKKIAS